MYAGAPFVDEWKPLPPRLHDLRTLERDVVLTAPVAVAVREVSEETGISGRVVGKLGTIDFWFVADGRRVHKTVHHFLLLAVDPEHGLELSDADLEVSEVAWVPLAEVAGRLAYADERRLLEKVPDLLAETA